MFCVSTFAISSVRAFLNPDLVFELWHGKRMLLIGAGSLIFWLAIAGAGAVRPGHALLRRLAIIGLPGICWLLALAVGWDVLITGETENLISRNVRWIMLWSGYLGTGLAAWLAWNYGAALAHAEQQSAAKRSGDGEEPVRDGGFWVKTGRQTIRIPYVTVEWIQAEGNYVRIHGADGTHGLIRSTLSAIEAELDADGFQRIHRSALCRRSAIRGYRRQPSGAMRALLASGAEAPLGRSYAHHVIDQSRAFETDPSDMDDTVSQPGAAARPA